MQPVNELPKAITLHLQNGVVITITADTVKSIQCIDEFVKLFPAGKVEESCWELACTLIEKENDVKWSPMERFSAYAVYNLVSKMCKSLVTLSTELQPLLRPWYVEKEE